MEKMKILLAGDKNMEAYVQAVALAGGLPDAQRLPPVNTDYDGLLLCGGNDIDPAFYGEEIDGAVEIHRERDDAEMALVKAYLAAGKPIFGICRGLQLLNVYFGGSLHQDLADACIHTNKEDYSTAHGVTAVPGGLCHGLYGEEFAINSYHHQGIKALGKGLRVDARSGELIEAVVHETMPVMAVQWHPERMCGEYRREDTADGLPLFQYFLELCERSKEK